MKSASFAKSSVKMKSGFGVELKENRRVKPAQA